MSEIDDIVNTLKDIAKFEAWEARRLESKKLKRLRNQRYYNGRSGQRLLANKAIAGIESDSIKKRREDRVKRLPVDMICPKCGIKKYNSRSWVVANNKVMCRKCYYTKELNDAR